MHFKAQNNQTKLLPTCFHFISLKNICFKYKTSRVKGEDTVTIGPERVLIEFSEIYLNEVIIYRQITHNRIFIVFENVPVMVETYTQVVRGSSHK